MTIIVVRMVGDRPEESPRKVIHATDARGNKAAIQKICVRCGRRSAEHYLGSRHDCEFESWPVWKYRKP